MARKKRSGDLELNQDMEFQRRAWIVQRVGWVFFTLVILLAALGLFGDGVLSAARAGHEESTLWVEYPRFGRFEDETLIKVHAGPGAASEGEVRLQLDLRYLDRVEVDTISPTPDSEIQDGEWLTYVFKVNDGNSLLTAHFYLTPETIGPLPGAFRLQGGEAVSFSQFIYP